MQQIGKLIEHKQKALRDSKPLSNKRFGVYVLWGRFLFSPLGEGFGIFWAQIRIPHEKLYIWSDGNAWGSSFQLKSEDITFWTKNISPQVDPYVWIQILVSRRFQPAIYTVVHEESEPEVEKCQNLDPGGKI